MQTIDLQTGEAIETALTVVPELTPDIFTNIAVRPVTDQQAAILLAPVNPGDLAILPTGEVYLPQVNYRNRLSEAFGPGGWAMRPLSKPYVKDDLAMQEWALYANGQFMAYAVGGATLKEGNQRMNWSDVLETAKSNALTRLCKDIPIAPECWNRTFTNAFKNQHCVKVWVQGQNKPQWRRLDSEPFYQETNIANDSPNRDKYGTAVQPGSTERKESTQGKANPKPESTLQPKPDSRPVVPVVKPENGGKATNGGKIATDPMTQFWLAVKQAELSEAEGARILSSVDRDPVKALDALQGISQPIAA